MPRPCATCAVLPSIRVAVEAELVAGLISERQAAERLGVTPSSVHRHAVNCLPRQIAHQAAHQARQNAGSSAPISAPPIAWEAVPAPPALRPRRRGLMLSEADDAAELPIAASTTAPGAPVAPLPAASSAAPVAPQATPAAPIDLLDTCRNLVGRTLAILDTAEAVGDTRTTLAAVKEARGVLESLAKLQDRATSSAAGEAVPLVNLPEWGSIRSTLMAALADHPEARIAVADALAGGSL